MSGGAPRRMREQVFVVDRAAFFAGAWPQGFSAAPARDPQFLTRAFECGRFVDRAEAEANPDWKQWIPYGVLRCGQLPTPMPEDERGVFTVQRSRGQSETRLHGSWSIGLGGHINPVDATPWAACGGYASATAGADGHARARAGEVVDTGAGSSASRKATSESAVSFFESALRRELAEELVCRPAAGASQFHALGPVTGTSAVPAEWPEGTRTELLGLVNDDRTDVGRVHAGLVYRIDLPLPLTTARKSLQVLEISKMHGGFASLVEVHELWQDRAQFESWSQFLIQAGVVGAMGGRSWNGPTAAK